MSLKETGYENMGLDASQLGKDPKTTFWGRIQRQPFIRNLTPPNNATNSLTIRLCKM
jgi:hypothetical protein